jgi:hypothetical protein
MSTVIRTEKYQRGPVGHIVKWLFIAFNVFMFLWLVSAIAAVSQLMPVPDDVRFGAAIGATVGFSVLLSIWLMGDLMLGLFVLLTRGDKVVVEETVEARGAQDSGPRTMDPDAAVARYIEQMNAKPQQPLRPGPAVTPQGFGRRSR